MVPLKNMKFETIESVPECLLPFYITEIRTELTGNKIPEQYESTDEQGGISLLTRMVDEYTDNTYVMENVRHDLKSWEQVMSARTYTHKVHCINKACEAEQWKFHDKYITWLGDVPREPEQARNENGTFVADNPDTNINEHWVKGYTPELHEAALITYSNEEPVNLSNNPLVKIAELDNELAQAQAINYLSTTDWMVARSAETGVAIPDNIKAKRAECRVVLDNTFMEPALNL